MNTTKYYSTEAHENFRYDKILNVVDQNIKYNRLLRYSKTKILKLMRNNVIRKMNAATEKFKNKTATKNANTNDVGTDNL